MEFKLLSQRAHFSNEFENVLRSSAIFYFRREENFKTTISFMNYWQYKRQLDVAIIASIRKMNGELVRREQLYFNEGEVVNYQPMKQLSYFEGSIEIEIFSIKNMGVPYPAIMVIYESSLGISMVHSYTRIYSLHEIEERKTITNGEEACWTLRDGAGTRSFFVMHNGASQCAPQELRLQVLNSDNDLKITYMKIPELKQYETKLIYADEIFPELSGFLKCKPGSASLSFRLFGAFTRLLIGNVSDHFRDLQITHSDFNYSTHKTDILDKNSFAYMKTPYFSDSQRIALIYPFAHSGKYNVRLQKGDTFTSLPTFSSGNHWEYQLSDTDGNFFEFSKDLGNLPTRLHTSVRCSKNKHVLPAEPSLGVLNELRPRKKFWWAIVSANSKINSEIFLTDYNNLYCGNRGEPIYLRLFSAKTKNYIEKTVTSKEFVNKNILLRDIFKNAEDFLNDEYGWITLYSDYGGYFLYSSLETKNGSISFDHGF